jgi:DNA-binding PadR family transcriptional regulator
MVVALRRARSPKEALVRDARAGLLSLLALRLLVERGPLHGYGVRRLIGEATGVDPPESSVYDALKRLERLGLAESFWARSREGTIRKYYRALPGAREALEEALASVAPLARPLFCEAGLGGGEG